MSIVTNDKYILVMYFLRYDILSTITKIFHSKLMYLHLNFQLDKSHSACTFTYQISLVFIIPGMTY